MSTALAGLNTIHQQLAVITTVAEAREVRDHAEALRVYAKRVIRGLEAQNHCAYVKILAERRAGELLAHIAREPGKRNGEETSFQRALRLANVALPTAHRWQVIAQVPELVVQKLRAKADARGVELTSAGVYRLAKRLRRGRWEIDVRGQTRLSADERYARFVTRIETFPDLERSLGLWCLSRELLERLLDAYLALRERVEANIATLRNQITIEIADYVVADDAPARHSHELDSRFELGARDLGRCD